VILVGLNESELQVLLKQCRVTRDAERKTDFESVAIGKIEREMETYQIGD